MDRTATLEKARFIQATLATAMAREKHPAGGAELSPTEAEEMTEAAAAVAEYLVWLGDKYINS